ncbi:MAG: hypothetical protein EYC70_06290 [Planctomycetota bacterium]|nr:MAG: hypothetical protein EYC70_06290 [Planctomycetota bacterium]
MALLAVLLAPGCALAVGAAAGAAAVYVTRDDEVEMYFDESFTTVFGAARAELAQRGGVSAADLESGHLEGEVEGATVKIWITSVTRDTRKCRVQARANAGISPDLDTAQSVAQGLAERLD